MALTGGLVSPLWPGLVGTTLGTFLRVRPGAWRAPSPEPTRPPSWWGSRSCPPGSTGPAIQRPYQVALAAWSILFTLYLVRLTTVAMNDAYQRIGETLDRTREDVIVAATARAKSLDCIGSKVAHELKNPLSAVKGLVQLLARSAADERSRGAARRSWRARCRGWRPSSATT